MRSSSESQFLKHVPCEKCGSSDAGALYTDSHFHCHRCGHHLNDYENLEDSGVTVVSKPKIGYTYSMNTENVEYKAIPERGITRATCEKYQVAVNDSSHSYPYFDKEGKKVAAKVRVVATKGFTAQGNIKEATLFGQQLYPAGGKAVTITEGELDALAAFQMNGSLYPTVSIKNGAASAKKDCQGSFEWLDSFDMIVICFDADEPGKKAAAEVAELFGPKAKIMKMDPTKKDACGYLQAGDAKGFVNAWWKAEEFRPEGIVTVADLKDELLQPPEVGLPWCFPTLTKLTYGRRMGELYGFGAGVSVGKTDFFTQQIAFDICDLGLKVGVIYLEQDATETVKRVAGKIRQKRFHKTDGGWTQEEYLEAIEDLEKRNQLIMMRHFGAKDWASVKKMIRYMQKAYGIRSFYLDHLTALAAMEQDERRGLDFIMADMAGMAQEKDGFIMHFISHLTTPEGTPHENGGRVRAKHFTGSRAIMRWAHGLYGLERDVEDEDPVRRQIMTLRSIKDRFLGDGSGEKFGLRYNRDTGILTECELDTTEAL